MFDSQKYSKIFPETRINQSNSVTLSNQFLRNREIIEFVNHHGYFRNTTVRGSITGETIDLGIIDDPIKGRAEANSQTVRDSSWDWLTDDFLTRFSDDAGLLCILTRWHIDDPIGRLIARKFGVKVLSFPAIATEDDEYRKTGDALFPELKPIDFLLERKAVMNPANFESLYQQNPVPPTGGTFKREWFKYWTVLPCFDDVVISVDCSFKKKEESSFVAIEVWGIRGPDSYFIDMTRERMGYVQTREAIRQMAYSYAGYSAILIEDKANGPAIIDDLSEELRGIIPIEPDGSKEARAESASTDYNAGNVFFPDPSIKLWTKDVVEEHACFPNFPTNDTVDAATQFIRWRRKHGGGVIIAD
jgi:predicted phage terminase large subunit-like protein